jgi:luciferase-like monooxygenase
MGRGRRLRRTLARGGAGAAQRLNEALGAWEGVRITPMFGRWGYFVGETLFACFPLREKERDLWLRLSPADQARALGDARIRPHRRFARRGWIEFDVEAPDDIGRALYWLRRAHATAARSAHTNEDGEA